MVHMAHTVLVLKNTDVIQIYIRYTHLNSNLTSTLNSDIDHVIS